MMDFVDGLLQPVDEFAAKPGYIIFFVDSPVVDISLDAPLHVHSIVDSVADYTVVAISVARATCLC